MDQTNKSFFAKGLHWPWGIVAFFVILALADALIVYYALSRHPDRTTANAYDEATRYESIVEELSRAKTWGLEAELSATKVSGSQHSLNLFLKSAQQGDLVKVQLKHAQYADSDRLVELSGTKDRERFTAVIDLPRTGNWEAEIIVMPFRSAKICSSDFFWRHYAFSNNCLGIFLSSFFSCTCFCSRVYCWRSRYYGYLCW